MRACIVLFIYLNMLNLIQTKLKKHDLLDNTRSTKLMSQEIKFKKTY